MPKDIKDKEESYEGKEWTPEDYELERVAREKGSKALRKIKKAQDFVSARRDQLNENMAFYQGNQYLLAQYEETRPWVIQMNTPHASMAIDKRVASIIANDYIGQLHPLTPDAVEDVEALQGFLEDEWARMNMDNFIDDAIKTSAIVREGYIHVTFDPSKKYGGRSGELVAKSLDTNAVLIDPRARDFNDAEYIVVRGRITEDQACEMYPDYAKFFPEDTSFMPEDRGEVYYDNDYQTNQDGILTLFTMYQKERGKIVRKEIVEGLCVAEKELKGLKHFPIAQMRWKKLAQSAYGMSLMDDVIALQKAISSIESAITNTAVAYASPAIIVRKGSGINPKIVAKTIGAPGVVYLSEIPIDEAMKPVVPAKVDADIVTLKKEFEMTIDKITGITNPFVGDIGTAGNTAQGSRLAVERAKIIEADLIKNVSEFVEQLTMIMIDFITTIYSGEIITTRRYNETSMSYDFKNRLIPEKASSIPFSYSIDLNMKTAYSKEREKEVLMELYQMERQYQAPVKLINEMDILTRYDLTNKDELVERYKLLKSQNDQAKAQTIMQITDAASKYQINPELTSAAISDVVAGGEQTPNLDEFMKQAQAMAQQMAIEQQASAQDLVSQGMDPQAVAQAEQMMTNQGMAPSPTDLGLNQQ